MAETKHILRISDTAYNLQNGATKLKANQIGISNDTNQLIHCNDLSAFGECLDKRFFLDTGSDSSENAVSINIGNQTPLSGSIERNGFGWILLQDSFSAFGTGAALNILRLPDFRMCVGSLDIYLSVFDTSADQMSGQFMHYDLSVEYPGTNGDIKGQGLISQNTISAGDGDWIALGGDFDYPILGFINLFFYSDTYVDLWIRNTLPSNFVITLSYSLNVVPLFQ